MLYFQNLSELFALALHLVYTVYISLHLHDPLTCYTFEILWTFVPLHQIRGVPISPPGKYALLPAVSAMAACDIDDMAPSRSKLSRSLEAWLGQSDPLPDPLPHLSRTACIKIAASNDPCWSILRMLSHRGHACVMVNILRFQVQRQNWSSCIGLTVINLHVRLFSLLSSWSPAAPTSLLMIC